jgi:hypothetical protein
MVNEFKKVPDKDLNRDMGGNVVLNKPPDTLTGKGKRSVKNFVYERTVMKRRMSHWINAQSEKEKFSFGRCSETYELFKTKDLFDVLINELELFFGSWKRFEMEEDSLNIMLDKSKSFWVDLNDSVFNNRELYCMGDFDLMLYRKMIEARGKL